MEKVWKSLQKEVENALRTAIFRSSEKITIHQIQAGSCLWFAHVRDAFMTLISFQIMMN